MLVEVTTNPESDKSLVVALDTIARYILGEERVAQITARNQARVRQIRTKSCNATSPQYFRKVSPIGRSSRNFNSDDEEGLKFISHRGVTNSLLNLRPDPGEFSAHVDPSQTGKMFGRSRPGGILRREF